MAEPDPTADGCETANTTAGAGMRSTHSIQTTAPALRSRSSCSGPISPLCAAPPTASSAMSMAASSSTGPTAAELADVRQSLQDQVRDNTVLNQERGEARQEVERLRALIRDVVQLDADGYLLSGSPLLNRLQREEGTTMTRPPAGPYPACDPCKTGLHAACDGFTRAVMSVSGHPCGCYMAGPDESHPNTAAGQQAARTAQCRRDGTHHPVSIGHRVTHCSTCGSVK